MDKDKITEEFNNKFVSLQEWFNSKGLVGTRKYITEFWLSKMDEAISKELSLKVEEIKKLPRYDVYDGGEALSEDGDYIRYSDLLAVVNLKKS